ncbi:MAG: molybdopterin oxidoreductase family protein, partial [Proteobacteria bacterium]|nr:molybdopterin oxidoreductase family protein [Pseudomonadota bacterium]
GFAMTEWEIIDETLKVSGYAGADDLYEKKWLDCGKDFATTHFINGFGTSDGKFHFAPNWAAVGQDSARMPHLPDHFAIIDAADDIHPFRLVTAPARQFLNTSFTETPTSKNKEQRPEIMLHGADMAALEIAEGDRVRVGNRQADLVIHARRFDGLQRGVAIVESVWPSAAFEEGLGINALTSAEAGPPFGGAVFHDTAVWVRKAEPPAP